MMNSPFHRGWRIAVIAGIPIYLEFSGFFALFIWASALSPKVGEWGIGLIGAMLLFLCVVLHELGHSLVGRYYGMQVNSIVLHGLGGVAYLLGTYRAPRQLWEVSLAGPLVNAILFGGLSVLSAVLRGMDGWVPLLVEQVKSFNLTMGLFNLIPILPLDGGQVVRALLWQSTGQLMEITRLLSILGYGVGLGAIAVGIWLYTQHSFTGIWLIYLGIWVCAMNKQEASKPQTSSLGFMMPKAKRTPKRSRQTVEATPTTVNAKTPYIKRESLVWTYLDTVFLEMDKEGKPFQFAMDLIQKMRFQEAIPALSEALCKRPSSAKGFHNRGNTHLKLGEPEQALSDFNTALRLDPDLGEAYLGRGNAYADLNELQQALKDYEHAVQLCPDSATALFNRATAYAELGDKTAAIRDFKQVQILLFDQGDTITLQKVLGRLLRLDAEIDADNFIVAEREQSGATAASAKRDEPSPLVQDKLLRLLKNDRAMAERLVAQARLQYPNRSERWYWEKVIWDVERDRFR